MSTIAWDGVTMAAEGRAIESGTIVASNDKKIRIVNGSVVGTAGEAAGGIEFCEFIEDGEWRTKASTATAMVIDGARGRLYEGVRHAQPIKPPYAIGSGAGFALAAMMAGADAVQAVKIACKLDPYSGGRIMKVRCIG